MGYSRKIPGLYELGMSNESAILFPIRNSCKSKRDILKSFLSNVNNFAGWIKPNQIIPQQISTVQKTKDWALAQNAALVDVEVKIC